MGTSVTSVDVARIGEGVGFVGLLARLTPAYEGGDGPRSMIAKLPSPEAGPRLLGQMYGLYAREARFYATLAPTVGIATPACYWAAHDEAGLGAMLLEDMAGRARVGDQLSGVEIDDALVAVSALAELHAAWWNSPRLDEVDWLESGTDLIRQPLATMYEPLRPVFEARFSERLGPEFCALLPELNQRVAQTFDEMDKRPTTLTHGDYRLDNMFFSGSGESATVTVCDWQSVNRTYGIFDISYFIITNLSVEQRRKHEMTLLRAYHDVLVAHGIKDPDVDTLFEEYRSAPLGMLALGVINGAVLDAQDGRGQALFDAIFERFVTASRDHDSVSLLP